MTNKYSGLSDAEIDYLVAEKRNLIVIDHIYRDVFIPKICSSYEDAFKLMIANKFVLNFNSLMNKWAATFLSNNTVIMSCNENPCRAIAETFLLMKDAENE